jgi:type II secretory pathway component PulF
MNDDLNIALFFEKMAELINADVPLIRAIEIAAYELTDTQLQKRFLDMISSLEKGQSITDTFRGHPDLFPDFHLSIIDIGESSGHLERSLIQVANLLRKKKR